MSVAVNLRRLSRLSVVLIGAGFIAACDSATAPDEPEVSIRTLSISVDTNHGTPGSRIGINGIPDDVDWVWGYVTVPHHGQTIGVERVAVHEVFSMALVRRSEAGDELVLPLHPLSPLDGGTARVAITDGITITSNWIDINIDSIPAAPGAFDAVVVKLETLLDKWIAHNGTSAAALRSVTADQLSGFELPLLLSHALVNHPDNPNTLCAFAAGDIPLVQNDTPNRELLDALTSSSGLGALLDSRIEFIDTLTAPVAAARTPEIAFGFENATAAACIEGPTFDIGPDDCVWLLQLMAYRAGIELDRVKAQDVFGSQVSDVVSAAMGFSTGAAIAWGIGSVFWIADNIASASRGLYPADFVVEPVASAVSAGWRFDDVFQDGLDKAMGVQDAIDRTSVDALIADVTEGRSARRTDLIMRGAIGNVVFDTIAQQLQIGKVIELEFCPRTWVDLDCAGAVHLSQNRFAGGRTTTYNPMTDRHPRHQERKSE